MEMGSEWQEEGDHPGLGGGQNYHLGCHQDLDWRRWEKHHPWSTWRAENLGSDGRGWWEADVNSFVFSFTAKGFLFFSLSKSSQLASQEL
jgi:hypothetical protein